MLFLRRRYGAHEMKAGGVTGGVIPRRPPAFHGRYKFTNGGGRHGLPPPFLVPGSWHLTVPICHLPGTKPRPVARSAQALRLVQSVQTGSTQCRAAGHAQTRVQAACLWLCAGQCRPRHPVAASLSRAPKHSAHSALHRVVAGTVQEFLALEAFRVVRPQRRR